MYCSTCGASIPAGRGTCDTCGSVALPSTVRDDIVSPAVAEGTVYPDSPTPLSGPVCPRCDYRGDGISYFSRGPHMAALFGATIFTLPYAFGAGGIIYYGLRRDHRVCPRCGQSWGRHAERALPSRIRPRSPTGLPRIGDAGEGLRRSWAIMLFFLAAVMLVVGVVADVPPLLLSGALAGAGGFALHHAARKARETRRLALIANLQTPVLKLAAERQGRLTVTEVAAALGWPLRRAEKILQSLDDGWRVTSDVTDEGVIVYEFRELLLGGKELDQPEN